jgi:hypothetical protein
MHLVRDEGSGTKHRHDTLAEVSRQILRRVPGQRVQVPNVKVQFADVVGPKDALKLPRSCYRDGEIATRRSKTGEPVFWEAPAELQKVFATRQCTKPLPSVLTQTVGHGLRVVFEPPGGPSASDWKRLVRLVQG